MADLSAMFKTDYTGKYASPRTFSEPVLTMDQLLIRDPTPMPKNRSGWIWPDDPFQEMQTGAFRRCMVLANG